MQKPVFRVSVQVRYKPGSEDGQSFEMQEVERLYYQWSENFYVCLFLLPASMKGSNQKQRRKHDGVVYPIISLWEFFSDSRAANSVVGGLIWSIMSKLIGENLKKNCMTFPELLPFFIFDIAILQI